MASALFSSIQMAGLTLPNRIAVSPMCMYSAVDGLAQPFHLAHVGQLALSGAGLVIMEATAVEEVGRISHFCLGLYTDEQEAALARLIRDIRSFSDTSIGIQLGHAGRKASCNPGWERRGSPVLLEEGGWRGVAPSAVAWGEGWVEPTKLDGPGLTRVKDAFVQATIRADRAGFDLIEVHGAHGYLLSSFFSPLSNFRCDRYGGSLENRMRFPLEVVAAMRTALSPDKPLGIRINGDDWHEEGHSLEDALAFVQALKEVGADYVTVSGGNGAPGVRFPPITPGYMVPMAARAREASGLTTMAVGMILSAKQAENIISSGQADIVALGRGALDDMRWGQHAAIALDEPGNYPRQYAWAHPKGWRGYPFVHVSPGAVPEQGGPEKKRI